MANRISASETRKMKAALDELKDSTRADYRKLAQHFYKTRLDGQPPTPKRIRDALGSAAVEYRPDYWRRLRNALMYDQVAAGYIDEAAEIAQINNPVTRPQTAKEWALRDSIGGKPGKRQKRVKKVSEDDLGKLWQEVNERHGDDEVAAAIVIATRTGARPAEMLGIKCLANNQIFIPGAKKTESGDRGLDRYIQLSDHDWHGVKLSVDILAKAAPGKAGTMRKIQDRLRTVTKRLWPRRKSHPTLYTWRYEMGSELKACSLSRREVAYVLGHQATASVDKYGDRRSGSGKTPIKAAPGADMTAVRETHTVPFSQGLDHYEGPSLG